MENEELSWVSGSTGTHGPLVKEIITRDFGKYTIEIALGNNNEFIDVVGVKISQKYLDFKVKIDKSFIDVDDLYDE